MRDTVTGVVTFLLCLFLAGSTWAVDLTAVTLFGCDEKGEVNIAFRTNSGPIDAAWDVFLYEGPIFTKNGIDPKEIEWLNDPKDHTIRLSLEPGRHLFTVHSEAGRPWPGAGMNLFFDGQNDVPAISAKTPMDRDGEPFPAFTRNDATRTMGWPITDVPASGSLCYKGQDGGIWEFIEPSESLKVTLKSFRFSLPSVDGNVDVVGPHQIGASNTPDFVGQFVLDVQSCTPRPSDLFVWLQTVANATVGGPMMADTWKEHLDWEDVEGPFSFTCGKEASIEILKRSKRSVRNEQLDEERLAHKVTYSDPETGLEVRWEGIEYPAWRTVEWTLFFKNTGQKDTPMIENIQALDVRFTRRKDAEFRVHYNSGDACSKESFEPLEKELEPEEALRFAPSGGRPTNHAFPYFNLRAGSEGVIIVVGWPGQWAAAFERDEETSIRVRAGQELTRFTLHPSEEVRTPLIVLQFAPEGDWINAQNVWRRWMSQHNLPRPGGKQLLLPQFNACSSHQFAEMTKANEANQIEFIDSYLAKGLKLDYWWMDAGWYVGAAEKNWPWTGTWEVDRRPHRFPNGLRAISDHAHEKGVKIILWFEPERVAAGTWLATEHPDWVLGGNEGGLLNLGDPDAWNWLVNHVDEIITREGIDLYRQDFNMDPLDHWRGHDAEDRQGITENKHVCGYLAYWDELLKRHPDMLIDSCASGGRRNDLETMRRAVPLLRSDYLFEPVGQQGHTYGLSFWFPFYGTAYCPSNTVGWGWGTGGTSYDPYTRRSNMCPSNTACFDFRVDVDDTLIQKLYKEWLTVAPDFFGDYYPLTPYNLDDNAWIAWQFNGADSTHGFIQAFRRGQSDFFGGQFRLRGLQPEGVYEIENLDVSATVSLKGKNLMEEGVEITIPERPGAATVVYRLK